MLYYKFLTPHSTMLESTLNSKSRNINLGDICLANPLYGIDTVNILIKNWGRMAKVLCTNDSLSDLNWQELQPQRKRNVHMFVCSTVQGWHRA